MKKTSSWRPADAKGIRDDIRAPTALKSSPKRKRARRETCAVLRTNWGREVHGECWDIPRPHPSVVRKCSPPPEQEIGSPCPASRRSRTSTYCTSSARPRQVAWPGEGYDAELDAERGLGGGSYCRQPRAELVQAKSENPMLWEGRPGAVSQGVIGATRAQMQRDRISSWSGIGQPSAAINVGVRESQERDENAWKSESAGIAQTCWFVFWAAQRDLQDGGWWCREAKLQGQKESKNPPHQRSRLMGCIRVTSRRVPDLSRGLRGETMVEVNPLRFLHPREGRPTCLLARPPTTTSLRQARAWCSMRWKRTSMSLMGRPPHCGLLWTRGHPRTSCPIPGVLARAW